MIDEINRRILDKRYERHLRGKALSILMAMDGHKRKPYTYQPLKNKPVPMPDQGLEWVPTLLNPLIDLNPPAYRMTIYNDQDRSTR